jgi:hypothetical protein
MRGSLGLPRIRDPCRFPVTNLCCGRRIVSSHRSEHTPRASSLGHILRHSLEQLPQRSRLVCGLLKATAPGGPFVLRANDGGDAVLEIRDQRHASVEYRTSPRRDRHDVAPSLAASGQAGVPFGPGPRRPARRRSCVDARLAPNPSRPASGRCPDADGKSKRWTILAVGSSSIFRSLPKGRRINRRTPGDGRSAFPGRPKKDQDLRNFTRTLRHPRQLSHPVPSASGAAISSFVAIQLHTTSARRPP